MVKPTRAGTALLAVLAATLCGCGGPSLYPVSGKVTYTDGTPVPGGGALKFVSKTSDVHSIEGTIQEDGTFSLTTIKSDGSSEEGAPPGEYQVYVVPIASDEDAEEDPAEITSLKYGDPTTSGITVTVEAKENTGVELQVERPIPNETAGEID